MLYSYDTDQTRQTIRKRSLAYETFDCCCAASSLHVLHDERATGRESVDQPAAAPVASSLLFFMQKVPDTYHTTMHLSMLCIYRIRIYHTYDQYRVQQYQLDTQLFDWYLVGTYYPVLDHTQYRRFTENTAAAAVAVLCCPVLLWVTDATSHSFNNWYENLWRIPVKTLLGQDNNQSIDFHF